MEHIKTFEALSRDMSIRQLKNVSKQLGNIDVGKRVSDASFANALNTKRNMADTYIQSYSDYLKEPFSVNQNRKPWNDRKKKSKKK